MKLKSQNSAGLAISKCGLPFFFIITGDINDFVQNETFPWFYLINGNLNLIINISGIFESKKMAELSHYLWASGKSRGLVKHTLWNLLCTRLKEDVGLEFIFISQHGEKLKIQKLVFNKIN